MPELPAEFGAIAAVPGLGPKRVQLICEHLHVRTLEDLRRAAQDGRLRDIRGVGIAVEKKVLAALSRPQQAPRVNLPDADAEARALLALLGAGLPDAHLAIAGSYRRRCRAIGDLDILVMAPHAAVVGERLIRGESVAEILVRGPTRTTVVLRSGLQVDLRAIAEDSYGAALLYYTGSKEHNVALRALAGVRGWKLNEYGLFAGKRRIAGTTEEELYNKLGLEFIPPEMREDRGEVALAKAGRLPHLVSGADIRGDLHVQCQWADPALALAPIAAAARDRGYEYVALVTRSKALEASSGPDLARRIEEIDRFNEASNGVMLLKGVAAEILADGSTDIAEEVRRRLDIVVGALRPQRDLRAAPQADRVLRAVRNPHVTILSLGPAAEEADERDSADIESIVAAAREAGCPIEIGGADGVDPDAAGIKTVAGLKLAVSSHAALPDGLGMIACAVDQARRIWATPRDVLNTRPLSELSAALRR